MAYVQSAQLNTSGTSAALAYVSNNTVNNLLLLAVRVGSASDILTSVTDSAGNTWTLAKKQTFSGDHFFYVYYMGACLAGANTVTVSVSSSVTIRLAILEYNDFAAGGAALDQVNSAQGTSNAPNSGNITTTVATELLFCGVSISTASGFTAGTNFTVREEVALKISTEDRAVTSIGTYSGSWTIDLGSDSWACIIATFMAAATITRVSSTIILNAVQRAANW